MTSLSHERKLDPGGYGQNGSGNLLKGSCPIWLPNTNVGLKILSAWRNNQHLTEQDSVRMTCESGDHCGTLGWTSRTTHVYGCWKGSICNLDKARDIMKGAGQVPPNREKYGEVSRYTSSLPQDLVCLVWHFNLVYPTNARNLSTTWLLQRQLNLL